MKTSYFNADQLKTHSSESLAIICTRSEGLWFLLLGAFDFEQLLELLQINATFVSFQFGFPTFEYICREKQQEHKSIFYTTSDPSPAATSCELDPCSYCYNRNTFPGSI